MNKRSDACKDKKDHDYQIKLESSLSQGCKLVLNLTLKVQITKEAAAQFHLYLIKNLLVLHVEQVWFFILF